MQCTLRASSALTSYKDVRCKVQLREEVVFPALSDYAGVTEICQGKS